MATNGINSSKAPARRGQRRMNVPGVPHFQGDTLLEHDAGRNGMLAAAQAEPINGLPDSTRDALLAKAGILIKRGSSV